MNLFEDTTIVSEESYSPNLQVAENEKITPRWLSHTVILSEKEEIHLELHLYFLKDCVASQCTDLIKTYIQRLIENNKIKNAVDFYDNVRAIENYVKSRFNKYIDCISTSYKNSPGQLDI